MSDTDGVTSQVSSLLMQLEILRCFVVNYSRDSDAVRGKLF